MATVSLASGRCSCYRHSRSPYTAWLPCGAICSADLCFLGGMTLTVACVGAQLPCIEPYCERATACLLRCPPRLPVSLTRPPTPHSCPTQHCPTNTPAHFSSSTPTDDCAGSAVRPVCLPRRRPLGRGAAEAGGRRVQCASGRRRGRAARQGAGLRSTGALLGCC